ncbi:uncharacterized protein J3R85_006524 [Psidium guajava]|nr:uncharacterized protein J3R85_006524 [Psidium guajava]
MVAPPLPSVSSPSESEGEKLTNWEFLTTLGLGASSELEVNGREGAELVCLERMIGNTKS